MVERPDDILERLVMAHRVLVEQNVLDAFGHVSVRDPEHDGVFWLSLALPPSRVEPPDFIAFDLYGNTIAATDAPLFSERFIHSSIYRLRRDVRSACHHHSASMLPFCISKVPLVPVSQTGAFMGGPVPLWDSAHIFGATRMLVENTVQGDSLAEALGRGSIVLMRGHGATVVGRSIEDVVFKSVFSCRDADAQQAAAMLGGPTGLSASEIALCGQPGEPALSRAWSHWTAGSERRCDNTIERKTS